MDKLNDITLKAIQRYFDYLDNMGYVTVNDFNVIRALDAINDLVNNFSQYITDKDYTLIMKALQCLGNNCFIDQFSFKTQESIFKSSDFKKNAQFRLTEDSILRTTENNNIRIYTDK